MYREFLELNESRQTIINNIKNRKIDEDILKDVIENHLIDIKEFAREMINLER